MGELSLLSRVQGAVLGAAIGDARPGVEALPGDWVRDVERSGELLALATRAAQALQP